VVERASERASPSIVALERHLSLFRNAKKVIKLTRDNSIARRMEILVFVIRNILFNFCCFQIKM